MPLLSSSLLGDFTVAFAVSRLVITGHLLSGGRRRPTEQAGLALLFHVANSLTLRWIQGWIEMVLGFGKNFVLFLPHFPPSLTGTIPKASSGWKTFNQPTRHACQFCTSSLVPPHPPRLTRLQSSSCSLIHLENLFVRNTTVLGSPSPSSFIPRRSRPESGDLIGNFASFLGQRSRHTVVQEHNRIV